MTDFNRQRERMVERQLRRRGIGDERVLAAMGEVPRELFVPEAQQRRAYADAALPIAAGQTISQPWIVAAICQALQLRGDERVLEVGSGSGYSTAVLSRLGAQVTGIERHEALVDTAREVLARLGVENARLLVGDGSRGLPDAAPFEAIAIHATAPAPPLTLLGQLADGGRLVVPLAGERADMLTVFQRQGDEFLREEIGPCRFVPLIGEEGFEPGTS